MRLRSRLRHALAGGLLYSGGLRMLQAASCRWERSLHSASGKAAWQTASAPKFVVLCYHRIGTGGIPFFSALPAKLFEAQIRFLTSRYRVVGIDELLDELQHPSGRVQQSVAITFDDGYRGVYSEAYPILRKYNVPATVYLTADCIENGTVSWYDRVFLAFQLIDDRRYVCPWNPERILPLGDEQSRVLAAEQVVLHLRSLPDEARRRFCHQLESQVRLPQREMEGRMLTWSQVHEMRNGGISFGAHTLSHPVVSRLADEELERELYDSRQLIEKRLGDAVRHFAFPFGQQADCGTVAAPLLKRLGYSSAATTCTGTNTPNSDAFSLRRISVSNTASLPLFAMALTNFFLSGEDCSPLLRVAEPPSVPARSCSHA